MSRGYRLQSENQLRAIERRIADSKRPAQPVQPDQGVRPATHGAMFLVRLPWPPTANNLYPTGKDGRRHPSPAARAFRESASHIAMVEMQRQRFATLTGPAYVSITLIPPDARAFDIDNRCKAVIDALQAANVLANDSQVQHLEVRNVGPILPGEGVAEVIVRAIKLVEAI